MGCSHVLHFSQRVVTLQSSWSLGGSSSKRPFPFQTNHVAMKPAAHPLRRPTPPAASPPPPPSPSPFASPSLPLPSAVLPPKKRRVFQTPRRAATPIPPPPPLPALARLAAGADSPAVPAPIPMPPAGAAASLLVAKKPPLRPTGKPPLPPRPLPKKPSSPPPPPPAADEKPSTPPLTDVAAESATPRKVRNYRRKISHKGAIAAAPAAAAAEASAAAGALHPGDVRESMDSLGDRNAGWDGVGDKDRILGETEGEKPVTGFSAVVACEALLGKKRERGGSWAGKTEDCVAPEMGKVVSKSDEEGGEEGMSEEQRRMATEVFVGGLDKNAKEADVRAAMAMAGEVAEVRMVMDHARVQKNKGFCFVRYREAEQARKAIEEFGHVKICTSLCRIAAIGRNESNDKIFLGNIDKTWKKQDIMELLQKIGIENINTVILKDDCNKPGYNRGYAHLELESTKDAQMAYKKLSRKGVFGRSLNITVAWAEPSTDPDDKEMQKVKSVFAEGIPDSWGRAKVAEIFKRYGKVQHVVLPCDMRSATSNDIAYIHYATREAAILCIESFDGQELTETDSKVNIKVSLARPFRKGKQNKEDHKFKPYPILHTPAMYSREKRVFSKMGDDSSSFTRHNPRARHESSTYDMPTSRYSVSPHSVAGYSLPYHHGSINFLPDSNYGVTEPWCGSMMRQPGYHQLGQAHGSRHKQKY
ncbi:hypothetical protein EJB05_15449, partial [Eragrostis curvula]